MRSLLGAVSIILGSVLAGGVYAQGYPNKPVRLINAYAAGGGIDTLARLYASKMQEKWGQPIVVESKPGAGGNIAADFVAKSAPDGYTLLITASTVTTNPYFIAKMPFDVQKDLAPISMIARQEFFLVVANSLPVTSVGELIAHAKANPGKLSYSTAGIGTPQHLGAELLKSVSRIDMVHVPYKGQPAAVNAVISGEVQVALVSFNTALPLVQAGRVRGLAVAAKERLRSFRDVAVVAETIPGFEVNTWFAIFASAGTPAEIVEQLSVEIRRISTLPDVQARLTPLGYDVMFISPQEFRAVIAAELFKWGKVAKEAGIKPE